MKTAVYSFPESGVEAANLAATLGNECLPIAVHRFPDGESLIRIPDYSAQALVYRSLDHPNEKLVELVLAAATLRAGGCRQIMLVAPYLGYMRQDIAFNPGEAVSQRVIGDLLSNYFDGVVTVDPHLHRTALLADVLPGKISVTVSAAAALVELLRGDVTRETLLVGPDAESRPWVESVAKPLGLEVLIGTKVRYGDRDVKIELINIEDAAGRHVILIDDVISSGQTLIESAKSLVAVGAYPIEAVATHGLATEADLARMKANGISRVRTTDSIPGRTAAISIAKVIAEALRCNDIYPHS